MSSRPDVVMDSDSDEDQPLSMLKAKKKKKVRPHTGAGAGRPAPRFVTDFSAARKKKAAKAALKARKKAAAAPPPPPRSKKKKSKKKRSEVDDDGDFDMGSPKKKSTPKARKKATKTKRSGNGDAKQPAKKKARTTVKKAPKPRKKAAPRKPKGPKKAVVKELSWAAKVERGIMAFKWWEAPKHGDGVRWKSMEHRGVIFPEPYEPHGVKVLYNGEPVDLPPAAEELATLYAQVDPEGPQLGIEKIAKLFNANFFRDFLLELPKGHPIKKFELCDFSRVREHVLKLRDAKKARTKAEKEVTKKKNADLRAKFMYCFVDGHVERLGNCMVEPPNLFRGRGEHPKTGTFKRRVLPEQITLNLSKDACVPECPMPGHNWRDVIHDPKVTWLATWKENVMGAHKYVFLAANCGFKGESDFNKYEKARELGRHIASIRVAYKKMLKSKDLLERQIGVAIWVVDALALRVGNEKDEDEADTVGCCSLRVEHLTIDLEAGTCVFDFLGKDSMRYFQTIDFNKYGEVGVKVLKCVHSFCKNKKPTNEVFDKLTPTILNNKLTSLMPGLSAKVFRTYNASVTLERTLEDVPEEWTTQQKGVVYDGANREVAILCNHQRTVSKAFQNTFQKLTDRRDLLKRQLHELRGHLRLAERDRAADVPLRVETSDKEEAAKQSHLFKRVPSKEQLAKRVATFADRLNKLQLAMKQKDDNKTVALGTAKINYMDPRITVAWCKRVSCPVEKVFSKALRDKFPWAMSAEPEWKF